MSKMRNIAMLVEYCGTDFLGFQVQAKGPTVQGTLAESVAQFTGEKVQLIGSGRTDSGVHAWGQVVNFHTRSTIPPERFAYALNGRLPRSLRVRKSWEAPLGFHARFSAIAKTYNYWIYYSSQPAALWDDRAWRLHRALDLAAVRAAIPHLLGEHDFTSFCASNSNVRNFVRRVEKLDVKEATLPGDYPLVVFSITANGFLYKMVRNIVGTLVEVGLGRRVPEEVPQILEARDRNLAGKTAPAHGLYLAKVYYPEGYVPED